MAENEGVHTMSDGPQYQLKRTVVLVGMMGSGKTAVGRRLAEMLDYRFYDVDHYVEENTGVDVSFIFEKEGEEGFRKREAKVIDDLSTMENVVLATGGGAIMNPENRSRLGARGFVVYLYTTVDQQVARTNKGRERPMLANGDSREILEDLMAIRDPLYREIADLTVETDGRRVKAVANEIVERL